MHKLEYIIPWSILRAFLGSRDCISDFIFIATSQIDDVWMQMGRGYNHDDDCDTELTVDVR